MCLSVVCVEDGLSQIQSQMFSREHCDNQHTAEVFFHERFLIYGISSCIHFQVCFYFTWLCFFILKVFLHAFVLLLTYQARQDSLALSMANLDHSGYGWGALVSQIMTLG